MLICERCGCNKQNTLISYDVVDNSYVLCDDCKNKINNKLTIFMNQNLAHPTIKEGAALILEGLQDLYNLEITADMVETPERVARMFAELCSGLADDPKDILSVTYPVNKATLIVQSKIDFRSLCRHHLAIISGNASIGYIPKDRIVGLSKLSRLVDCYAKRPQIQEEMTNQIADDMVEYLDPLGVIVFVSAQHGCMSTRGVLKQEALTSTSAVRGVFLTNDFGCKDEFFAIIGKE
jgi:GTP cyclohydrolase I